MPLPLLKIRRPGAILASLVVTSRALFATTVAEAMPHPPELFPSHWESRELHDDMWLDAPNWDDEADPFEEITGLLPDPNEVRLASGAPGPAYWQQRADHDIAVRLDPVRHRLEGSETVTYFNESPHELTHLWMQIDQNLFRKDSIGRLGETAPDLRRDQSTRWMRQQLEQLDFDGGAEITRVELPDGTPLAHRVIGTMMRIDLPGVLPSGASVRFEVDWNAAIVPSTTMRARSGYEILDDGMPLYEIAQWFPRMVPYTAHRGWQNKQFQGESEFALEFGNYDLAITVPETYVVAASGELQNPGDVLTEEQQSRLAEARTSDRPMFVITPEEALANEIRDDELEHSVKGGDGRRERTWKFRAENVRDVAWAASPTFIWDAWGVEVPRTDGEVSMAMSFYPNEGEPLWSRYSTQAVAHTIEVYSEHTVPYPYPVAISVNGPVGGMEYPMICFNGPRPEKDGTYSDRTKWGLIGVVIHEVGHNWFPMIINSDERQWTWMDEGMNTFVQFLAMETWEDDPSSRRGEPHGIVDYMISERQRPIMTHGESIIQKGPNAYAKPSVGLNLMRETLLGRELFDESFREYCRRWAFKSPEPADFFRSMEDMSGTDLDWFFRNWFFTTNHVDIAVERVFDFTVEPRDPEIRKPMLAAERDAERPSLTKSRNADAPRRSARYPELLDFYSRFDELEVTDDDRRDFERFMKRLDDDDRAVFEALDEQPLHFSIVRFRNLTKFPMPLPLEITWDDGSVEDVTLPVEIWKMDPSVCTKMFVGPKAIARVRLDPARQIADADRTNNAYPPQIIGGRFGLTPSRDRSNPMQSARARDGRPKIEAAAKNIAIAIGPVWSEVVAEDPSATPVGSAGRLLADLDEGLLVDPWDRAMRLEFSTIAPGDADAALATLRSDGRDGKRGTDDDVALAILADGRVIDEAMLNAGGDGDGE